MVACRAAEVRRREGEVRTEVDGLDKGRRRRRGGVSGVADLQLETVAQSVRFHSKRVTRLP